VAELLAARYHEVPVKVRAVKEVGVPLLKVGVRALILEKEVPEYMVPRLDDTAVVTVTKYEGTFVFLMRAKFVEREEKARLEMVGTY